MPSLFTNNHKIALSGAATSSSFAEPNPIREFVASREDASNIWLTARIGRRPAPLDARLALAARSAEVVLSGREITRPPHIKIILEDGLWEIE